MANLYISNKFAYGFEHLYLVYDPQGDFDPADASTWNNDLIIRGGPALIPEVNPILIENGEDIQQSEDQLDGADPIVDRNYTLLSSDAASLWATLTAYTATMGTPVPGESDVVTQTVYRSADVNSNSVINTVLNIAGINLRTIAPQNMTEYPAHLSLLDGSGNSTYTAYIYDSLINETNVFYKRNGNDTILLEWNNFTDEHAKLHVYNEQNSTGLTTVYFDGLDFADVDFDVAGDDLTVDLSSDELVRIEDYYLDRTNDLAEGAQTTAFEFEDIYYRLGNAGDNVLSAVGISKNARLEGGDGDDVLKLGTGATNHIDGGDGFDRVDYTGSGSTPITIDWISETEATDGRGGTLLNIESFTLGSGNDTVHISPDVDATYHGRGGSNTVDYSAIPDESVITLTEYMAGYVTDSLGNTLWDFGTIRTTDSGDYTFEYDGFRNVTIQTGSGDDTIFGGEGDDILDGGAGTNAVYGGDGDDYLDGSGTLFGGEGNDTFSQYSEIVYGGDGDDTYLLFDGTFSEVYDDGGTVILQSGYLIPHSYSVSAIEGGFLITLKQFVGGNYISIGWISLYTPSLEDWSFASGVDPVDYFGTGGNDIVDVSSATRKLEAQLYSGNDTYNGSDFSDTVFGDAGDDVIYGGTGNDFLYGESGNDTLYGESGHDSLYSYEGENYLNGGAGNDTYYLGKQAHSTLNDESGNNVVIWSGLESSDVVFRDIDGELEVYDSASKMLVATIETPDGFTTLSFADNVIISVLEAIEAADYGALATGLSDDLHFANSPFGIEIDLLGGDDIIIGSPLSDTIYGGADDDSITGGGGSDFLYGGGGNDYLNGSGTLEGNDGNDIIVGSGNLIGGDGDDMLTASYGVSSLSGGSGNDVLYLNAGFQSASGNAGDDRFVIQDDAQDIIIADFFDAGDRLDLTVFNTIRSIDDLIFTDDVDRLLITADDESIDFSIALDLWSTELVPFLNFRFFGAPDVYDDLFIIEPDAPAIIDVLDNDQETNGAPLSVEAIVEQPIFGSAVTNLDGTITYTPRVGFTGQDYFTYTAINDDDYTDLGTVSITVLNPGGQLIAGTMFDETLTGGSGDDFLYSSGGEVAEVYGAGGDDFLYMLSGGGDVDGGTGTDTFELGSLNGNGIVVSLASGTGYEIGYSSDVTSLVGIENLMGSYTDDVLTGDSNNNVLSGNTGSDTIDGGAGTDTVNYRNFLSYNSAAITVNLATGTAYDATDASTDTLVSIENVIGGVSGDTIVGNSGVNVLEGWEGNDTLEGGAGNDTLSGGDGVDTARYANAASAVTVNLSSGTATGGDGSDTLSAIENVIGSAYNDTLIGSDGVNTLDGGDGADTLWGGAGNDSLNGNAGADTLYGQVGDDTLIGGDGNDTIYGDIATALETDGNDVIEGNAGDDTLVGGGGDDEIDGGADNDLIYGAAGADLLYGGAGADTIYGDNLNGSPGFTGAGNDVIYGGDGNDIVAGGDGDDEIHGGNDADDLYGNAGADTINGDAGADDLYGGDGADILNGGAGIDILFGGNDADTLNGGDDGDTLSGDAGDDILNGDAGADTLYGGSGNDTLNGGDGNDILYGDLGTSESGSDGDDTIYGGAGNDTVVGRGGNDTLYGGADNDTMYGGSGADTLYGDAGTDILYGDAGADILHGGDGNDTLLGGNDNDTLYADAGFDTLWGQSGNDTFVFAGETAFGNVDKIGDFASGDLIDISDVLSDFGYDSGTHTLTDWVSITTSGSLNYLAIDRDGTGSTYGSFTNILYTENYTALTTGDLITV